jgi:glycosyltransferase involved in cell wall biosynthesis
MNTSVVIPVLNEFESLGYVLSQISTEHVSEIIVVDGGSSDGSIEIAKAAGAQVIQELKRGYGQACAAGVKHVQGEIVVFLDADGADDPLNIPRLIQPILAQEADMVLGSRLAGVIEIGAMPWQQYFGNWFSAWLIRKLFELKITDLSPFRAVRKSKLMDLGMTEMTYGWPTEMIVKAALQGWQIQEIPVNYRSRYAGESKISGTLHGTVLATYFILATILRYGINAKPWR